MGVIARLLVLLLLLWVEGLWAVDCPQSNYTLSSQGDVDALGATGCDSVSGYLYIGHATNITNLDGLANITSVGDELWIDSNDALANLDLTSFERRGDVDAALAKKVADPGVRQFLLKGLYRAKPDQFAWRYNLPVLRRHLADMTAFLPLGTVALPTLAIYGTRSDYVVGRGLDAMHQHFPHLEEVALEAGHWLHAEQPAAFREAVTAFLDSRP